MPLSALFSLARSIVFSLLSIAHRFPPYAAKVLRIIFPRTRDVHEIVTSPNSKLRFLWGEKLLSGLSTWGIGGPCRCFVQVSDKHQLVTAIRHCNEQSMRYMVIGRGSNCLFDDLGFDGCIIQNRMVFLEKLEAGVYRAGSGYPIDRLGVQTANEGFGGLEFAAGIPGTVGGAVYMNAGANGQDTASAVESIEILTTEGELKTMERSDLSFGYRKSPFQDMNDLAAITAVTFRLQASQSSMEKQQQYAKRRKLTQPVGEKSCGSVFRNPHGTEVAAAQLIEKAGLKGFKVGRAMISEKHANFFINSGGATSRDMLELIGLAVDAVYKQFGIKLKEEILYIHPYI